LQLGKFCQYFRESFAKISLKIEPFRNLATIFYFQNLYKNENIGEHSICNFSTIFLGGREIAQEGGEILQKVMPKL